MHEGKYAGSLSGASQAGKAAYYEGDRNDNAYLKTTASSEIERELGSIESILELMAKQVCVLEDRLRVVMRPDAPPATGIGGPSPTPNVPLAAGLAVFCSKLSYLSQNLDNITSRIDF